MKCVKCDGRLVTVRVDDVDVDQCDRCGGVWFDAHELERVLGRGHLTPLARRGAPRPDDDARQKISVVQQRLVTEYGYDEHSAKEALSYVTTLLAQE